MLLLWLLLSIGHAATFNVRDYGAKGDGVSDDSAAVKAALQAAVKDGVWDARGNIVLLPPGRYLITEGCDKEALFDLSGMQNLTVQGSPETLILKGDHAKRFFFMRDCRNVLICDLKLDEAQLGFTQGIIRACDVEAHTCTVEIDVGYDAPDRADLAAVEPFRVFTDPKSNSWDQDDIPRIVRRQRLPDGKWLFTLDRNGQSDFTGKKVLVWLDKGGGWGFDIIHSWDTHLDRIAWYGGGYGNAFATNDCDGDVTLRHFFIGAPPGTDRLIAGIGSHQGSSRGRLTIEDCDFSRFDDDGVNTLSPFYHILAHPTPETLIVQGHRWRADDRVSLWDWTFQQQHERAQAVIVHVKSAGPDAEVRLDHPVTILHTGPDTPDRPKQERDGVDRIVDLPQVGTLTIRRTRISCSRARALLVKSHDALIEHCTIYDSHYGLQAGTETYWAEGPQLLNLTVRGCIFENVDAPALDVGIFDSHASRDCRNILIEGNVFRANGQRRNRYPQGTGLRLRNVDGAVVRSNRFEDNPGANIIVQDSRNVRIEGNTFVRPNGREIEPSPLTDATAVVWIDACEGVALKGNVVMQPGAFAKALVKATASCKDVVGLGEDGMRRGE